jgi:hypothetical protein
MLTKAPNQPLVNLLSNVNVFGSGLLINASEMAAQAIGYPRTLAVQYICFIGSVSFQEHARAF